MVTQKFKSNITPLSSIRQGSIVRNKSNGAVVLATSIKDDMLKGIEILQEAPFGFRHYFAERLSKHTLVENMVVARNDRGNVSIRHTLLEYRKVIFLCMDSTLIESDIEGMVFHSEDYNFMVGEIYKFPFEDVKSYQDSLMIHNEFHPTIMKEYTKPVASKLFIVPNKTGETYKVSNDIFTDIILKSEPKKLGRAAKAKVKEKFLAGVIG